MQQIRLLLLEIDSRKLGNTLKNISQSIGNGNLSSVHLGPNLGGLEAFWPKKK